MHVLLQVLLTKCASLQCNKAWTCYYKCSKSYACYYKRYRPNVHHYKCTKRCAHYYKCKNVSSCCCKHKFYRWMNLWHQWMGHLGVDNLKSLAKMTCRWIFHQQGCRIRILWRLCAWEQHQKPFPLKGGSHTIEILALVHCNVWGSGKTTSLGGVWYFLTFIDNFLEFFFAIS